MGPATKVVVGRDEKENALLESAVKPGEATLRWLEGGSPLAVILGCADDASLETAAGIMLRYTKAETGRNCRVKVDMDGCERFMEVANTFDDRKVEEFRI